MTSLSEQLKFYFTTFHTGALNTALHITSIPFLYFGFANKNIPIIIFGFSLDGLGHLYNFFFKFSEANKRKSIQIIPLVGVLGVILCFMLMAIFGWF